MAQISQQWIKANEVIEEYKKDFHNRFGFTINIYFQTRTLDNIPQISLQEIYDNIEEYLYQLYTNKLVPGSYGKVPIPNGLKTKSRVQGLRVLRQIFCNIALEFGYSSTEIARFIDIDHATVLHSKNVINELLETKDRQVTELYCHVKSNLAIKYGEIKRNQEQNSDSERST